MTLLKDFYSQGEEIIGPYGMNTTAHGEYCHGERRLIVDAFWGPSYWSDYNPSSNSQSNFTLDTHQYYAFPPLNDLPHETILDSICNISQILHSNSISPTIVGEWSLESGQPPNSTTSWRGQEGSQQKRTWQRLFFEAQLAAYSPSAPDQAVIGWYYWTCKFILRLPADRQGKQNGTSTPGPTEEGWLNRTSHPMFPTHRHSLSRYCPTDALMPDSTTPPQSIRVEPILQHLHPSLLPSRSCCCSPLCSQCPSIDTRMLYNT